MRDPATFLTHLCGIADAYRTSRPAAPAAAGPAPACDRGAVLMLAACGQ